MALSDLETRTIERDQAEAVVHHLRAALRSVVDGPAGNPTIDVALRYSRDVATAALIREHGPRNAVASLARELRESRAEAEAERSKADTYAQDYVRCNAKLERAVDENARLRAALAEATATLEAWHVGNAGHMCADPGWRVAMQDETGRQLNRARAALDGVR